MRNAFDIEQNRKNMIEIIEEVIRLKARFNLSMYYTRNVPVENRKSIKSASGCGICACALGWAGLSPLGKAMGIEYFESIAYGVATSKVKVDDSDSSFDMIINLGKKFNLPNGVVRQLFRLNYTIVDGERFYGTMEVSPELFLKKFKESINCFSEFEYINE